MLIDSRPDYNIGKSHLKPFIHFAITITYSISQRKENVLGKKVT